MLWHQFAIRLGLAMILGALIGAERQWRQRMAGLRTNALVAAGPQCLSCSRRLPHVRTIAFGSQDRLFPVSAFWGPA